MRRSALLAAALAALAAGCRDSEVERVTAAVHAFVGALERGDGTAACERLSHAGLAELFLVGVRVDAEVEGLEAPPAGRCALLAERLATDRSALARLRAAPVSVVRVEGDRATVETRAGAYEAEESDGRWLVSGFEPVARVFTGDPPTSEPVHLTIVRPKLHEPAPGPVVAGRADDEVAEVTGTLAPEDAAVEVRADGGTRVGRVEARDGRFRVRLELERGLNEIVLTATAPERERIERVVRLTLD